VTRATHGSQQSGTVCASSPVSRRRSRLLLARPFFLLFESDGSAPYTAAVFGPLDYGCQSHRPGQPAAATQSRRDRERPRACPGEPSIAHKRPSSAVSGRSRSRPHVDLHGAQGRCCSSMARSKAVEDSASCRSPGLPAAPWSSLEEEEHHAATACRRHEIDEPRPRHIRTQPQRAAMAVPLVFTVFLRPQRGG
jgi:hypothetical protein